MSITDRFTGSLPRVTAREATEHVPDGATVVTSGFGSVGYPKAVPLALAARGDRGSLTVITGGSVGEEIDTELVTAEVMARRIPYLGTTVARDAANAGDLAFQDRHVSQLADEVRSGQFGSVDVAIVEAVAVGPDWLVPSQCLGPTPAYVHAADRLVVEVNRAQPLALQRIHDVYSPSLPPNRDPVPLTDPLERIGEARIAFDAEKLVGVVETDRRDSTYDFREPTPADRAIADHLGSFLVEEVGRNPTMADSLCVQFGVGSLGNALAGALDGIDIGDRDLVYYGEVIQDGVLDLLDSGRLVGASGTSLALSTEGQDRFVDGIDEYASDVVLRPADISNGAELVQRFGVVAVNSALEVDLYGNLNSTHVDGTHALNGLGGSGDYNRNALVTVAALPSSAGDGEISRVVPMVPHVDHTEHDVDVVVTEHGVADLRGCAPRERTTKLVAVADPTVRDDLRSYVDRAQTYGGNTPHDLETALSWPLERQRSDD